MRQKVLSILALLLMTATGAWADTTVTWTESDMKNPGIYIDFEYGDAFYNTIKGITVTASAGGGGYWKRNTIVNYSGSTKITFTSSVGNIKSIAITALNIIMSSTPSGWTLSDDSKLSWSGDASPTVSMTLSGESEIYNISEIVFTIESSTVNVTGITLDKTEASMIVGGETLTLTPTVAPNDATDKTVTWTTSDANVATVADGVVTAVGAGIATITATATNGTDDTSDDKTATCTVTVSNPTVTANDGGDGNYWATYYNATKSFTADENTTVYKAALNGTSSVTLTEVAGREIPATQAVILKSTAASITLTPVASTTADLSDNVLKGGTTITDGYDAYTLSRGSDGNGALGFYQYSGGSLDGSKAHLEISSSSPARSFIGIGDGTTAIELPAVAEDEAAEWYSLDGRRLSGKPARKGIYVKDGQKYIIK